MRSLAIAASLLALLAPLAEAGPGRAAVQARLRPQVDSGRLRLDVEGLPFGPVTFAEARETPSGNFAGTARFGAARASALLHFVPDAAGSNEGTWLLALKPDVPRFSALSPHVAGTPVDQLELSAPVLAFAISPVRAKRELLGAEVEAFYGKFARVSLDLQKGINPSARTRRRRPSAERRRRRRRSPSSPSSPAPKATGPAPWASPASTWTRRACS